MASDALPANLPTVADLARDPGGFPPMREPAVGPLLPGQHLEARYAATGGDVLVFGADGRR
jgi:hypothetical protein